jgi:L-alanine-DL-glutamate epimerase-like enolase superfamily enzyme
MAIKSFIALESDSVDLSYWKDLIHESPSIFRDGYVHVPQKPGLGIALNTKVCREHIAHKTGFFD